MRVQLLFLFILTTVSVYSSPKKGDRFFNNFNFTKAAKVYERYLKRNSDDISTTEKLATTYRLLNDWQNAEPWYARLIEFGDSTPSNVFYYAISLRSNQSYALANEYFELHSELTGSDFSKNLILSEDEILDLMNTKGVYVSNLGINSAKSDFGPYLINDKLFFTSNRNSRKFKQQPQDNWNGTDFLNMFMVDTINENNFGSIKSWPLSKLNGRYHEGPVAQHPNGDLYLTRTNYTKKRPEKSSDKTAKLRVFVLKKQGDSWSTDLVDGVDFNSREYSVSHVTFNEDGSVMYFASDMPGGYGNTDIWKATFNGETYTNPENLGPTVNTVADDMFPFYHDGVLYFASAGWPGLGGLDVFSTKLDGELPKNLGAPINSNYDDFSIYFKNPQDGYFSSNRPGVGSDDIYSFNRQMTDYKIFVYNVENQEPIEGAILSGNIFEEEVTTDGEGKFIFTTYENVGKDITAAYEDFYQERIEFDTREGYFAKIGLKKPETNRVKLQIFVKDFLTKEPISHPSLTLNDSTFKADEKGFYEAIVEKDESFYLHVDKKSDESRFFYIPESAEFNTKDVEDRVLITVLLKKLEKGKEFEIKNIFYDLDKYSIRKDAAGQLDNLLGVLKEYPNMIIELRSHTDCRHSKEYNMDLSTKRAKSAMDYLISNGIEKKRMAYKGYGETKLVNDCACEADRPVSVIGLGNFRRIEDEQVKHCTEEQHQMNRRTTFVITDF